MAAGSMQDVEAMRVAIFVVAGLAIGSFLTVVAYRLPRRGSGVSPPSSCPPCGTMIGARGHVPLLSYLLLRGKCPSCGARISPAYPAIQALPPGPLAAA